MANDRPKNKAKATRKPPSRVRYEGSHPTVSCRISKDEYDLLKQRLEDLGGVSFAAFVKEALGLLQLKMPDIKEIKEQAYNEGYEQATEDCQVWYYCNVCGKRMDMEPNSDSHKAMIRCMKERGWAHKSCQRQ